MVLQEPPANNQGTGETPPPVESNPGYPQVSCCDGDPYSQEENLVFQKFLAAADIVNEANRDLAIKRENACDVVYSQHSSQQYSSQHSSQQYSSHHFSQHSSQNSSQHSSQNSSQHSPQNSPQHSPRHAAYIIEEDIIRDQEMGVHEGTKAFTDSNCGLISVASTNESGSKENGVYIIEELDLSEHSPSNGHPQSSTPLVKCEKPRVVLDPEEIQPIGIENTISDKMQEANNAQPTQSFDQQQPPVDIPPLLLVDRESFPVFPGIPVPSQLDDPTSAACPQRVSNSDPNEPLKCEIPKLVAAFTPLKPDNTKSEYDLCNLNESRAENTSDSETEVTDHVNDSENQVPKLNLQGLPDSTSESANSSARSDVSLDYLKNILSPSYPFFHPNYPYIPPYYPTLFSPHQYDSRTPGPLMSDPRRNGQPTPQPTSQPTAQSDHRQDGSLVRPTAQLPPTGSHFMPFTPNMVPFTPNMMPFTPNMIPFTPNMMPNLSPNRMPNLPPNMIPNLPPNMMPNLIPNMMPNLTTYVNPTSPHRTVLPKRTTPSPRSKKVMGRSPHNKKVKRENRVRRTVEKSDLRDVKLAVRCYSDPNGSCAEKFESTYQLICHIANVHNIERDHACRNCAKFSFEKQTLWKKRVEHEKLRSVFLPNVVPNENEVEILVSDD